MTAVGDIILCHQQYTRQSGVACYRNRTVSSGQMEWLAYLLAVYRDRSGVECTRKDECMVISLLWHQLHIDARLKFDLRALYVIIALTTFSV